MTKATKDPTLVRVMLDPDQLSALAPLLDACRAENSYEGIFAMLCRTYSPSVGGTILELQLVHVPRRVVAKVIRLLAAEAPLDSNASREAEPLEEGRPRSQER